MTVMRLKEWLSLVELLIKSFEKLLVMLNELTSESEETLLWSANEACISIFLDTIILHDIVLEGPDKFKQMQIDISNRIGLPYTYIPTFKKSVNEALVMYKARRQQIDTHLRKRLH